MNRLEYLLSACCDKCKRSNHTIVHVEKIGVYQYRIVGHCELCATKWILVVMVTQDVQ